MTGTTILHLFESRLELFGSFRLRQGDQPVAGFEHTRIQHLLAYLALHGAAPISRRQLAFLFWPDSTDQQALKNLRTSLARLRHALPDADHFIDVTAQNIQWRPEAPFTLDVAEFMTAMAQANAMQETRDYAGVAKALKAAVDVYAGELLPDCYDDWVLPLREHFFHTCGEALEQLVVLLEEQREYGSALPYARRLLNHDPLRESAYHHLVRLHLALGDRTEALRVCRACDAMLEREFGTAPARATQDLFEDLLETELRTVQGTVELPLRRRSPGPPMVGRNAEWSRLMAAWRAAVKGRPQMVLLSGEAGIGKTRLAEELCAWVTRQGVDVATAHCYPTGGGSVAYAPVVEWLRSRGIQARLAALEDVWLVEIARILPALLVERPHLKSPGPLSEAWQRTRLFEALARGLERGEPDIMDRSPRPVREPIINREMLIGIAVQAVVMTIAVLGAFIIAGAHPRADLKDPMLPRWETVAFATLVLSELLRAFTARSERISLFKIGLFSNKWMVYAVLFSFALVLAAIYVPFLNPIFDTVPLTLREWLWIIPFSLLASVAAELTKIYLRARAKKIETALTAQMELA